jgi:glutathione S-transferase
MRPSDDEIPVAKRARMTPKLELLYFNVDGKGEPLRLMMGHAKLAFDDTRISFEQFTKMKESGELAFGQVPMLKVDGTAQLVQTSAIARYIAQISGDESLYPSDPLKAAKVDAICEQTNDMYAGILPATYQERFGFDTALGGPAGDGTKKVQAKLRSDVLPRHLGFLQKLLDASKSGWLADTAGPSAADFIMAPALKQLPKAKVWGDAGADDLLAKFPKVQEYVAKFYALDCCKAAAAK